MGYQTVKQVPTLTDYFNANRRWEQTKPIRGRSNDLRPLAERRYADSYNIRKNPSNQAIECVLYQTPSVTFMPDGEVLVSNGGWATASTHMFMCEVLGTGVSARGQRGKSIVTVGGNAFTLGDNEVLRLRKNELRQYEVLGAQTHYDYKMNRTATNNVRARYKEFYNYLKGFVKLRAHESQGHHYGEPHSMIECTFTELADCIGAKDYWDATYRVVLTGDWDAIDRKPGTGNRFTRVSPETYEQTVNNLLDLIKSDQPEETKHTNFHKAALVLLTHGHSNIVEKKQDHNAKSIHFIAERAKASLDTTLLKWFADEVLTRYELPRGKTPGTKYAGWLAGENT